jgi:hypothetical protein
MEMKRLSIFQAFAFRGFAIYFAYFRHAILYAKYVDLLDKLKEVKKTQFFSTVHSTSYII